MIVTDKMNVYPHVIGGEFQESIHIKAGLRDAINNNKLERFHGTWKRDKVMRGLENVITAKEMIENMRTYYNFIRGHSALDGHTPSEMAGIDLNLGRNRWLSLLEKAL